MKFLLLMIVLVLVLRVFNIFLNLEQFRMSFLCIQFIKMFFILSYFVDSFCWDKLMECFYIFRFRIKLFFLLVNEFIELTFFPTRECFSFHLVYFFRYFLNLVVYCFKLCLIFSIILIDWLELFLFLLILPNQLFVHIRVREHVMLRDFEVINKCHFCTFFIFEICFDEFSIVISNLFTTKLFHKGLSFLITKILFFERICIEVLCYFLFFDLFQYFFLNLVVFFLIFGVAHLDDLIDCVVIFSGLNFKDLSFFHVGNFFIVKARKNIIAFDVHDGSFLDNKLVPDKFVLLNFKHSLLDCMLSDHFVDVNWSCLADSVSPIHCLRVILRVPINIINDNNVCRYQINTKSTCSCW